MAKHDKAVRALINRTQKQHDVDTTKADHIDKYPNPEPFSGEVPDIVFEFSNGKTNVIEVDTDPMSENDKSQHETFNRSVGQRSGTTYNHYLAEEVL